MSNHDRPRKFAIGGVLLTERELRILQLVAEGKDNKEIAPMLGITTSHLGKILSNEESNRSLYRKIGVQRKPEAAAWYERHKAEVASGHATFSGERTDPLSDDRRLRSVSVTILTTAYALICAVIYLPVFLQGCHNCAQNYWSNTYFVIPLIGGVCASLHLVKTGALAKRPWGMALLLMAIGSVLWSLGGVIWLWYNVYLHIELPYPGPADYAYTLNEVFECVGIGLLWRRYVNSSRKLILLLGMTLCSGALTIYAALALRGYQMLPALQDPMKFALDIYYPTMDTLILIGMVQVLAALNIQSALPVLKSSAALLVGGLTLDYFANITFCLTSTVPASHPFAFYNGGISDFAYTSAFFLIALSILIMPVKQL